MLPIRYVTAFALIATACAQQYEYQTGGQSARPAPARIQPGYSGPAAPKPTPIAILKQINRHNEDGSYTYGYEGADGSFKIETKLPTGEVKGKYGYVDDTGKVRVVEYGATKYGFEPSGEGITVAPPTLVDETTNKDGTLNQQYQDQDQYYEPAPAPIRSAAPRPAPRPRPQPSFESFSAPQQFAPAPQNSPVPQRANIVGAAPVTSNFEFGPSQRQPARSFAPAPSRPQQSFTSFANAAPVEEQNYAQPARPSISYAQPAGRSEPQFATQFAPAPRPAQAAPQYTPRTNTVTRQSGGGILDQLAKDYALPQGGSAALHDISFGYY